MNVELCENATRWDAYVQTMPSASNYHRWGWRRAIENTFGHRAYYLAAMEKNEIKGVLPLLLLKSRLFGLFLVSMPFFSYGGILAEDPKIGEALLTSAVELGRRLNVSHIELRQCTNRWSGSWQVAAPKVTMELCLPDDIEQMWNALSSGMRNKIRKSQKNGLQIKVGGAELVGTFYKIFSKNMRNLGTPVYPEKWFANLFKEFPSDLRAITITDNQDVVGSGIISTYRKTVEVPWSSTLPESRKRYSAVGLYWALIDWAIKHRFVLMDFGRCTKGGGVYEFKQHWNTRERPLYWHYWLSAGKKIPELRPDNPRYRFATQVWKHLPLAVANFVGPSISRSIP